MTTVQQNPFTLENVKLENKEGNYIQEQNELKEDKSSEIQNEVKASKHLTFAKEVYKKKEEAKIEEDNLPVFGPHIINTEAKSNQKELKEALSTIAQLRLENISLKEKLKFLEDLLAKSQASQFNDIDKCKICNEQFADLVIFPCHDCFCEKCANSIIKKDCPICHSKVDKCKPLG